MFHRLVLFVIIFIAVGPSYAYGNLVHVVKLRGTATQLGPGMHEAKDVALHEWYPKDTSILTGDKSFVLLKYKNGGNLTLGPSSKVVVDEAKENSQAIIALLTGKIKASVESSKANATASKLIVKTKTAALGVRGTSFQTSYNPRSNITSLVTFKGKVALAKFENNKPITKVDQVLKEKAVEVTKGEYAGVSDNLAVATTPVKISPEQFTKLKLNETLGATEEKLDEKTYQTELKKDMADLASESTSEKGGTFKASTGSYTPRPGGLVDIESGMYVPPPKDAEFDSTLKVYKATTAIGSVNDDGSYRPPEGLKLEPGKGFVVNPDATTKSEEVTKLATDLNQNLAGQLVQPTPPKKKSTLEGKEDDAYERYFKKEDL
ncbi:MAG: FecR domain-containing protein [Bdellovibrio sp.]|nr:FecR domain-containing protein [Bdellovibrio sp.]